MVLSSAISQSVGSSQTSRRKCGTPSLIPILIAILVFSLLALIIVQRVAYRRRFALQRSLAVPRIGQRACMCVTDIELSTLQNEHNATAYAEALLRHNELVRSLMNVHNGHELSTEGDSFTVIFHTAADGLAFSLDLQRGLLHADIYPREYTREGLIGEAADAQPLTSCCEELDQYGNAVLFRGLRVRVAIAAGVLVPSSMPSSPKSPSSSAEKAPITSTWTRRFTRSSSFEVDGEKKSQAGGDQLLASNVAAAAKAINDAISSGGEVAMRMADYADAKRDWAARVRTSSFWKREWMRRSVAR